MISPYAFTHDLPYIVSILFTRVKFRCVRVLKLRDSGNLPLGTKLEYENAATTSSRDHVSLALVTSKVDF